MKLEEILLHVTEHKPALTLDDIYSRPLCIRVSSSLSSSLCSVDCPHGMEGGGVAGEGLGWRWGVGLWVAV